MICFSVFNDYNHSMFTWSSWQEEDNDAAHTFELDLLKPLFEQTACTYRVSTYDRHCLQEFIQLFCDRQFHA
jgi:hypothetical protein